MAVPTWTVGEVLTAADVNSWFVPVVAYKATDQGVTSSTTLVNDTALFIALEANATYDFDLFISVTGALAGTGDVKLAWTYPSGTIMLYSRLGLDTSGTLIFSKTVQTDVVPFATAGSGTNVIRCQGTAVTSTSSGNLQLQWAQNTSSSTTTYVKAQSYLTAQRIA